MNAAGKKRFAVLALAICQVAPALALQNVSANMKCDIGPVSKQFGGTSWLVYSCQDNASLVIKSAPSNKAVRFQFSFLADEDGFALQGKGQGDKQVTDDAYRELNAMSEADIAALVLETRQASDIQPHAEPSTNLREGKDGSR